MLQLTLPSVMLMVATRSGGALRPLSATSERRKARRVVRAVRVRARLHGERLHVGGARMVLEVQRERRNALRLVIWQATPCHRGGVAFLLCLRRAHRWHAVRTRTVHDARVTYSGPA